MRRFQGDQRIAASVLASTAARPAHICISLPSDAAQQSVGQPLYFNISTDRNGDARCYQRDARSSVTQIYPNPLQPAAVVEGNRSLTVPEPYSPQSFTIEFSRPRSEEVRCLSTTTDVSAKLPANLQSAPLEPSALHSLDEREQAFADAAGEPVGRGSQAWTAVPR